MTFLISYVLPIIATALIAAIIVTRTRPAGVDTDDHEDGPQDTPTP